ncbi:hypothetical protein MRB53_036986 [Persea americana]|nr:hypothetical protein MRB53_036986 [Persea americana]
MVTSASYGLVEMRLGVRLQREHCAESERDRSEVADDVEQPEIEERWIVQSLGLGEECAAEVCICRIEAVIVAGDED